MTFSWTYDDPNNSQVDSGTSVTHTYLQVSGQTSATVNHNLVISVYDSSGNLLATVPLTVSVLDTQEGALLAPETWTGDHLVTGVVSANNFPLTIAPSTNVHFQGDLADGFGQGITASTLLTIGDNTRFASVAGQTQGWGTIQILGNGTVGQATIQAADRAISIGGSGTTTLTGTLLENNATGIQIVGNGAQASSQPAVTISGATITGNSVYGVKEDAGARPVLTNSTIQGNFRDYYSWNGGLLNIATVNALAGNSGNQGE
jgi:hypothetical protein